MNQFDFPQVKGTDSYSKTATKQASSLAGRLGPIAPQFTGEVYNTVNAANHFGTQSSRQNQAQSARAGKEKKFSYVSIEEMDTVKRRLFFDDIPVNPENESTEIPSAPPKKTKSVLSGGDVNGIRKFR